MKKDRTNECGHLDKPHYGRGMCWTCWRASYTSTPEYRARRAARYMTPRAKAWRATYYEKPEVKAREAAYYAKPEVKARRATYERAYRATPKAKAQRAAHDAKPENKARLYSLEYKTNYDETLYWFLISIGDRRCWLCKEVGERLHLDHNHETLEIRGWAHQNCNHAEGNIRKSPNPTKLLLSLCSQYNLTEAILMGVQNADM